MWVKNSNFYFPCIQISDKLHFRFFAWFLCLKPWAVNNRQASWRTGEETDAVVYLTFLHLPPFRPLDLSPSVSSVPWYCRKLCWLLWTQMSSSSQPPSLPAHAAEILVDEGIVCCRPPCHRRELTFPGTLDAQDLPTSSGAYYRLCILFCSFDLFLVALGGSLGLL